MTTIAELQLGMAAEIAKTYDEWDVYTFAGITGDLNPAHVDQTFAEHTIFKGKVAHGLLTASLISAVLGMKLPGPGTIYLAQDLKFLHPVRIGDTVTARVAVIELVPEKNLARLMTTCTNQAGERLLEGTALVMPPRTATAPSDAVGARPRQRVERPARVRSPRTRKQGLLVGDRMTSDPIAISPDATVAEASHLLTEHRIRHLPVVEGAELRGMVTDSDVRRVALPGTGGASARTETLFGFVKVREIMTTGLVTISPDATIGQAARLLLVHKVGGLPVVKDGRLVGIVTVIDALAALVDTTGV